MQRYHILIYINLKKVINNYTFSIEETNQKLINLKQLETELDKRSN